MQLRRVTVDYPTYLWALELHKVANLFEHLVLANPKRASKDSARSVEVFKWALVIFLSAMCFRG